MPWLTPSEVKKLRFHCDHCGGYLRRDSDEVEDIHVRSMGVVGQVAIWECPKCGKYTRREF